ncbi:hypothetical protein EJD97_015991 [Solanum chilense]|uniref:Uncharacterized protein n=1 Tax=Solanum chilense TaxID=4083 RepID=A0A6N2B5Y6_SOLCI|nr:hypothetical protein EJD97_015991 [Solanum chilense]
MTTHFAPVQGHRKIKKTITHFEKFSKVLVLPFAIALAHVFPHCAYVVKMKPCKDYAIVCADLFENHGLSYSDEIELYWDS